MWDLIVSVPDHCISFYFTSYNDDNNLSVDSSAEMTYWQLITL